MIRKSCDKGQSAIEYLILLATVVAIVLVGFRNYMPRFREASNTYFNRAGSAIYGDASRCGDGCCGMSCPSPAREDSISCPADC